MSEIRHPDGYSVTHPLVTNAKERELAKQKKDDKIHYAFKLARKLERRARLAEALLALATATLTDLGNQGNYALRTINRLNEEGAE